MIPYAKYTLDNGLRILLQKDNTTTVSAVNILYDVGSRDEDPARTGFAHLFEHLMFDGSINIPDYDGPLQKAGGENNAFTSNDITNFYLTLPQNNLETAFWLESDRMLELALEPKSLEVQRNVVIEEFKQRYLNQPYGDLWLLFRPLAYKVHPYQWATIGKNISHIEQAVMEDVAAFYARFYHPQNAILTVVSGLEDKLVLDLAEKWFAPITKGEKISRSLPVEPEQITENKLEVTRDVPFGIITLGFHMASRRDADYYAQDLISDVLSSGKASRLYDTLVRKKRLFSEISAHITGDMDPGLFVVYGKLSKGVSMKDAEESIWEELESLTSEHVHDEEMERALNRLEATRAFGELTAVNRAYKMGYAELVGDLSLINNEVDKYRGLTKTDVQRNAQQLFCRENCSTLYYFSKQNKQ